MSIPERNVKEVEFQDLNILGQFAQFKVRLVLNKELMGLSIDNIDVRFADPVAKTGMVFFHAEQFLSEEVLDKIYVRALQCLL